MKKGIFIDIEGVDSSGKHTQAELLKNTLEKRNFKTSLYSFPAYETTFGKLVAAHLRGEFWKLKEVMPEIACMLYAMDRYQFRDEIKQKLSNGEIVITDRFTPSAMAYHGAMVKDSIQLVDWVKQVESRMTQPDIVIFLDVPVEATKELIEKRKGKDYLKNMSKDIYEHKMEFQKKARNMYLEIAKREKNWRVIKCVDSKLKIRDSKDIHNDIMKELGNFL